MVGIILVRELFKKDLRTSLFLCGKLHYQQLRLGEVIDKFAFKNNNKIMLYVNEYVLY